MSLAPTVPKQQEPSTHQPLGYLSALSALSCCCQPSLTERSSCAVKNMSLSQTINTGEGNEEDGVLSLLISATKAKPQNSLYREAYEDRLLTFKASTYCAKPACLSPMVCARFGWCNADRDMLACTECHAALAISMHSNLSATMVQTIFQNYRQKLATAHKPECSFRLDAEQSLLRQAPSSETVVPSYLASVFPSLSVELLEHPAATILLKNRTEELEKATAAGMIYPELELSREVRKYQLLGKGARELIWSLPKLLGTGYNSITTLALLGWTPIDSKLESDPPMVSLGCPICLAWMDLALETSERHSSDDPVVIVESDGDDDGDSIEESAPKRRRAARFANPLTAHRHYCPYVCGFPTDSSTRDAPVWQGILERVCRDSESTAVNDNRDVYEQGEETFEKLRKILRSGIAAKSKALAAD